MVLEVIESLAGMVGSMLEFPVAGMLGRLLPAGGSEAGQQVATAVGTGLDNLGSLCSQTGLDRWELLGLAVLSAITVYRKELSSNSVYHGKEQNSTAGGGGATAGDGEAGIGSDDRIHMDGFVIPSGFRHAEGCPMASGGGAKDVGDSNNAEERHQQGTASADSNSEEDDPVAVIDDHAERRAVRWSRSPCDDDARDSHPAASEASIAWPCQCLLAASAAAASTSTSPPPSAADRRRLRMFVESRIRSLDLPVAHLQQLRASLDKSWSSFATAWEVRRSRDVVGNTDDGRPDVLVVGSGMDARGVGLILPPCTHRPRPFKRSETVSGTTERGSAGNEATVCDRMAEHSGEGGHESVSSDGNVEHRVMRAEEEKRESQSPLSDQKLKAWWRWRAETESKKNTGGEKRDVIAKCVDPKVEQEKDECPECAALAAAHTAAHAAAASILNGNGTVALLENDDAWTSSALGALPADALQKALGFLDAKNLLTFAKVAVGAQEAVDDDLVWRQAWVTRFGSLWESDLCREAALRWHLHGWNPKSSSVPQGWKTFYSEFEVTWLEWVAAGQNTESSCMVGLYGRLYNITDFMHRHPGSPETLMDNAGADATEFFEDVGHSQNARDLMKSLESLAPSSPPTLAISTSTSADSGIGAFSIAGFRSRRINRSRVKSKSSRDLPCVLSSAVDRIKRRRARAIAKGKVFATDSVLQAGEASEGSGTTTCVGGRLDASQAGVRDGTGDVDGRADDTTFRCNDCGKRFDPAETSERDTLSTARRSACEHVSGTLRVFYVPVRAQWAGFYSCCRQHMLL